MTQRYERTNERTRIRNSLLTCIQQGRPLILASRPEKRTPKKQSSSIKQTDRAHLSSKRRREMDLETTSKLESNAKQRRQARWGTWFEVSRLIFPVPSPPSAVLFVVIFPHFLFFGFSYFFFFFFLRFSLFVVTYRVVDHSSIRRSKMRPLLSLLWLRGIFFS